MIRLGTTATCAGVFLLCAVVNAGAAGVGPVRPPGLEQVAVGDTVCRISIDVPSKERARELGLMGIRYEGVGDRVLPFSEELLANLEAKGFEPRATCFQLITKVVPDTNMWRMYMGQKDEKNAARPVLARSGRLDSPGKPGRRILLLNSSLAQIASKPYSADVTVSRSAQYIAFLQWPTDVNADTLGKWEIFHHSGQKTADFKAPVVRWPASEVCWMGIFLSDAGNFAKIEGLQKLRISFYSKKAKLLKEVILREQEGREFNVREDFSEDGRYLALQIIRAGLRNEVVLYTSDGDRIWRFIPDEHLSHHSCIAVSQNGSYVISSFRGWDHAQRCSKQITYLLDKKGSVIRRIDNFGCTEAIFYPSGKYVALFSRFEGVVLLRLPSGDTVFHFHPYRLGGDYRDFDVAENGQLVGILEHTRVVLLDFSGKRLWKLYFPGLSATRFSHISLSRNGEEMAIAAGNTFYAFKHVE